MCFSATASFGIGTVLVTSGVIASKKIKEKKQVPFALIPFIFGVQQCIEGFVWLSLSNADYAAFKNLSTHSFIFIAQVIWPTWVPLSIWLLEKNNKRKDILLKITYLGILISAYLAFCLFYYPVNASTSEHHIHYDLDYPVNRAYTGAFYFIPTVIPALISTTKKMWIMGVINLLSFLVTKFFFGEYVVSVWCYFAAALSILVLYILHQPEESTI